MTFKIALDYPPGVGSKGLRWHLDLPIADTSCAAQELAAGLLIQGWLVFEDADDYSRHRLYFFQGLELTAGAIQYIEHNRNRPDVVQRLALAQVHLACGFRASVPLTDEHFELGIETPEGERIALVRGQVQAAMQILRGAEGWLFLNNDTNDSVAQHSGERLLSTAERDGWRAYAREFKSMAERQGARHCLLIAPAKEAVYADKHPIARGQMTLVEQVVELLEDDCNVQYPEAVLRKQRKHKPTFRMKDSHWTHFGALHSSIMLAHSLGARRSTLKELFEQAPFRLTECGGDLGNKCFPPERGKEWIWAGRHYNKHLVYDNQLENFGRVIMLHNKRALSAKQLLLFGSSSSYSMFHFLVKIFRNVVFVHSAGNIDPSWLAALQPRYLVAQTNARFMVRPPAANYSLKDEQAGKLSLLSSAQRETLQHAQDAACKAAPAAAMQAQIEWAQSEWQQAMSIASSKAD